MLKAPIRLDFIGGWSDQRLWPDPAAVLNASATFGEEYPLTFGPDGHASTIEGEGTGLGISSIRYALEFLAENPGGDYSEAALQREREAGTRGGWQDAIGALEPGLKLLTKRVGHPVEVAQVDASTIWPYLLVFDSGIRRDSGRIGDKVREAITRSPAFRDSLRENVKKAHWLAANPHDPKLWMNACIAGFARLNRIVEMQIPFPCKDLVFGWKPLGAGGGGYGLAFLRDPGDATAVIVACREAGVWACQPVLANGREVVDADSVRERSVRSNPSGPRAASGVGAKPRGAARGQRGRGRNSGSPQATASSA